MINQFQVLAEQGMSTIMSSYEVQPREGDVRQSEAALEKRLIEQLVAQGYGNPKIHNEKQLIANLREQLERLNDYTFTDNEWDQFFKNEIAGDNMTIEDKTTLLQRRGRHVLELHRDNGELKNIMLINKDDILRNSLQVINQYVPEGGNYDNRYDVTILVNGLPMVHIELKVRGGSIKQAFNQINRYQRDSFWVGSALFDYVQIFVISNGSQTKYYSNTTRYAAEKENEKQKKVKKESNSFEFTSYWADAENKPIADLEDFTKTFLAKHTLLSVLVNYCVFTVDNILMVMRPYQIAATERILLRISQAINNKMQGTTRGGGFIWHTTGSGKTLTSFKTAQLAAKIDDVKKVLFVVDRQDLDYQTMKEYDKFEEGCANSNTNSGILLRQLNDLDPTNKIIITTIQKLSNLLRKQADIKVLNENIVMIFDECHRSQFGEMHEAITKRFKKYMIFGFTGTPIFAKNAPNRKMRFKTTAQLFGGELDADGEPTHALHTYTIIDAIRDKNVLPFRVDYISTIRKKGSAHEEKVWAIDTEEALHSDKRVENIVTYVREHFAQLTKKSERYVMNRVVNVEDVVRKGRKADEQKAKYGLRGFNAMFAADSVPMAIKYYEEFKRQQEGLPEDQRLKIATIFTFAANEEENEDWGIIEDENPEGTESLDPSSRDALKRAIDDYNKMFGTSYDTSSEKFQNYYKDISLRMKNKEIDLLIVVGMFLTGFDAQSLNTLWVDKNLKLHGLLQAYSRTNRILNSIKNCGNIVCFRNLEKATDESIALFGDKDAKGVVLMRPYADYYNGYTDDKGKHVEGYKEIAEMLVKEFPVMALSMIVGKELKHKFVRNYGFLMRTYNFLSSFDDFTPEQRILTEGQMQDYNSWYNDIHDEFKNEKKADKTNINDDLEFEMELMRWIQIDIDYILMLIKQYHDSNCEDVELVNKIRKAVKSSPDLRDKLELIDKFIETITPEKGDIYDDWDSFVLLQSQEELETIITEEGLKPEETRLFVHHAFEEGLLNTNGVEITTILPQMTRFSAGRAEKKATVIEKLNAYFEKFVHLINV